MSPFELALCCEASAGHISFLETGRAQASRAMALRLAEARLLPLGTRNTLLQAAGFAPVFPASALASDALGPFRATLACMMNGHAPNPALLVDRHWNIHDANGPARALLTSLQLQPDEGNAIRLLTQGPRAAAMIANLPEVIAEMTGRLQLEALEAGTIGTSEDVTVRDLRLELLFPAGEATQAFLTAPPNSKSFLVLFFKKEPLPSPRATDATPSAAQRSPAPRLAG